MRNTVYTIFIIAAVMSVFDLAWCLYAMPNVDGEVWAKIVGAIMQAVQAIALVLVGRAGLTELRKGCD